MTSGTIFLVIGTGLAAMDLVIAHFAARRADRAPALDGQPDSKRAGIRVLRIGALMIFLIFAALAFGLIPSPLIQPIQLH